MATVTVHEAKTNLSKLIVRALAGEEIVIARGTDPQVKLVAVEGKTPGKRVLGGWEGQFKYDDDVFAPMTDDELREWGLL